MSTEMELTLEQTQQGVSYEVSNIRVILLTVKMEILLESTSNKLMVEHAEFDESDTHVLERFDTLAGNPIKEILRKLNLPDHRSILTDSKMVVKEMIEAYEGILEERRNDVINRHWEQNYNEAMEEVAKETSAHASFIVKNNVGNDGSIRMTTTSKQDEVKLLIMESNLLDSSRGCRIAVRWDPFIMVSIISCQKEMFISFIYGENDHKDRVALWNNLRAHNEAIEEYPWVILGDFNLSNAYASFLPFVSSDHSPAILTFLDVVGRKKRSLRFMNYLTKKNEFLKVVEEHWNAPVSGFLREELKKVQRELDKDPGDAEGDHNSAYFHKVVKGRKSRSRIGAVNDECGNSFKDNEVAGQFVKHFQNFLSTKDQVFPLEDPSNLFTKKLSNSDAVKMVENVTDEEIKVALFDIDDDKASGPDGFTSKFFKAS
ncbi:RNA-directed DNA polymerase, eukaryota, reverse transcriptase zinc-binding domain protein [Tanacetum coccineum]